MSYVCGMLIYDILQMFEREFRTWRGLSHQNILPLIGLTYQFGPIPCLITPWMDEGALTDFIHRNHSQLTVERKFVIVSYLFSRLKHNIFITYLQLQEVASGLQYRE